MSEEESVGKKVFMQNKATAALPVSCQPIAMKGDRGSTEDADLAPVLALI